jgi:hypothetical protein
MTLIQILAALAEKPPSTLASSASDNSCSCVATFVLIVFMLCTFRSFSIAMGVIQTDWLIHHASMIAKYEASATCYSNQPSNQRLVPALYES